MDQKTAPKGAMMIKDPAVAIEVQSAWHGVRHAQALFDTYYAVSLAFVAPQLSDYRDLCHSLTLVFAYGVLKDVLEGIRDEGTFASRLSNLDALMKASSGVLPWADFALVNEGRERRNDVAHEQKIVSELNCRRYIDAIERELIGWKILPNPVKVKITYQIKPND